MGGVVSGVDPWAIDAYPDPDNPDVEQGISAEDARYLLGGMMATNQPLKAFNGIIPEGGNAAGNPTGLLLETTSPASGQVLVNPGRFVAQGQADSSPYLGGVKGPALIDITPGDPTNPRIDLIVGDPSPQDPPSKVYSIDGIPDTDPQEPELPDRCVKLGTVSVGAGQQAITQVVPYRVFTSTVGGIRLVWNDQGLDLPGYPGQLRNHDGSLDQWDHLNSRWSVVHGRRIAFTPVLRTDGPGQVFGYGSGAVSRGWFQFLQRDVVHVSISVRFGAGVSTAAGALRFDTPPRATPVDMGTGSNGLGQMSATIYIPDGGSRRWMTFRGYADVRSNSIYPMFPVNAANSNMEYLRSWYPQGSKGTGIPAVPDSTTLFNGVTLSVHGTYEVTPGADSA